MSPAIANTETSPVAVSFHPAVAEHYEAIAGLLPKERELFLAHPTGKHPLTVEQVAVLVEKRLDPTVMVAGGRVTGFAGFYRHRPGKFVFLGNVMVDSGMRGQGLGRQLIRHMVALAFGKYGLPQIRASVFSENSKALLCCVQCGFRPYSVSERRTRMGERLALVNLRLDRERFNLSEA